MKLPFSPARVPGSVRMRKVCSIARTRAEARTSPVQSTVSEGPPGATVVGKIGSAAGGTEGATAAPPTRPDTLEAVGSPSAFPETGRSCQKALHKTGIPKKDAHKNN